MGNRWRAASALVAVGLAACGCSSQGRWGSNDGVEPVKLPPRVEAREADAPALARSQQPEGDPFQAPEAPPLPPARPPDLLTGLPAARIGATVNKEAILNEEVLAAAYQGLMAARDLPEPERTQRRTEAWNAALNQLIDREVVLQDAFARLEKVGGKKNLEKLTGDASEQFDKMVLRTWMKAANAKTEDEFRDFLKAQGVSLEMLRRQWERNFMAMEYLRSRVHSFTEEIGPKQILEYYDKHPDEFRHPDSVQWQDLFILTDKQPDAEAAHRLAEQLAERARAGEDFAKLAQQYDNGDSAFRHGEGIGAKRGEIRPPEVENILFQLKDGETAVVALETGFHVVRLVKREHEGVAEFDEKVQKRIKDKLVNQTAQVEMKRVVATLRRGAVLVYNKGDQ
jgi:parvulin-like peptidyl-prolyl isomerase